ncbi:YihY/virulence factor BrkB family protein [Luteimonas vadosa]
MTPRKPARTSRRKPAQRKGSKPDVLDRIDPTEPASVTTADGAPPPRRVETLVRRAQGSLPMAMLRRFLDADLVGQAAALAFYAALSLGPLILLLLWLTASSGSGAQELVVLQVRLLVGPEAETVARTIIDNAATRPDTGSIAGWWSIALLLVGATAVFAKLQDVLNLIFRTDATRLENIWAWLRKRVLSFGVLLALGFLLLVSMAVTTALDALFARIDWLLPTAAHLASFVVYAVAFAFMYHFMPDRRVRWYLALRGGALTAALFLLGRAAIAWYLQRAPTANAYGAMGALLLTMLWVYYAAIIVFIGALATAVVDERIEQSRRRSRARKRAVAR